MKRSLAVIAACSLWTTSLLFAAEPISPPVPPGQAIVPADSRKPWGELVSLDLENRTGTFRNEATDERMDFVVEPYAELLHHGADGDLQDFTVGERAIFRIHPGEEGRPWRLTYIQSEMNFLNGHKEFYFVDAVDRETGRLTCRQAKADQSFVRTNELFIDVDDETKYFRGGKPATFADVQVGTPLQTKTHGIGRGKDRLAKLVFLDVESLQKFQAEQQAVHARRMRDEGLPGFVDTIDGGTATLTLFREAGSWAKKLKPGMTVRLAATGPDRQAQGEPIEAQISSARMQGVLGKVSIASKSPLPAGVQPTAVVRLLAPTVFD